MKRVQTEIFLGIILVLVTSSLLLVYGIQEGPRMAANEVEQEARSIEVGAALFEANCTGCHGPKAGGVSGLGPPLSDQHFFTTRLSEVGWSGSMEDYIVATVSSGRLVSTRPDQYAGGDMPAMPAWADAYGGPLREDQIRDIAHYIMNFKATALQEVQLVEFATPTPVANDPVSRGQIVYTSNICTSCHTLGTLSSGTAGPNLTDIGTVAAGRVAGTSAEDYIRQSILDPNAFVVETFNPDVMPKNFGELLTKEQLDDLVAFLAAQK